MCLENERSVLVAIATNALASLPAACRAALVAGYFERRTCDDVAAITKSSVPEAKAALHDAAWSFRRQLGESEG